VQKSEILSYLDEMLGEMNIIAADKTAKVGTTFSLNHEQILMVKSTFFYFVMLMKHVTQNKSSSLLKI
jgi:hypothetical protein